MRSEVAHHAGKTLCKDVATAFQGFLALLTTFGSFQFVKQLLELVNIKVIFGAGLTGRYRRGHVNNALVMYLF